MMPAKSLFSERISGRVTSEMKEHLNTIRKRRRITENEMIREALRFYLDHQDDVLGSRAHFNKAFNKRIDRLEDSLSFQMNILINIVAKGLVLIITWLSQKEVKVEAGQLIRDGVADAGRNYRALSQYMEKARPPLPIADRDGDQHG